jgi:starch phosphorylase
MVTKSRRPPKNEIKIVDGQSQPFDAQAIKKEFLSNLHTRQARFIEVATHNDLYMALAHTVRDRMMHRFIQSSYTYFEQASRTVAYLSAEFLIGPQLGYNLMALGAMDDAREAMAELGISLDSLLEHEEEPGLGNGGLGRLAACYMDSLATLQIPTIGYGIRYEFGIFDQQIRDGHQVEVPDRWLRYGYPWEVARPDAEIKVKLGGRTESGYDSNGRFVSRWIPERIVNGVPCDTPVLGYGVDNANFLRLWQAVAHESLDLNAFHVGDYVGAVQEKIVSENITKVLYPNDQPEAGKILRLEQEYFFVSCSLQDMIRIYLQRQSDLTRFHEKYAIQLNDTHPAIAVAELMRLLVDEHGIAWDKAWHVTTQCLGYTNHTLLPEALEVWALPLFKRVLPRHVEIIFELNQRFLDEVRRRFPRDDARISRLSLIDEHGEKAVRMANLACVGSHAINGVAELHTDLLKSTVLRDFYELWPHKFSNVTNGVTPRRFVALANPGLSKLATEVVGPGWLRDYELLRGLEPLATDAAFVEKFRAVKRQNKVAFADIIRSRTGVVVDPDALFDVHVKRIHEYKRQHLNVLHTIALYRRIKEGRVAADVPRVVIFGGKAAPGYFMAKLIIQLINDVAGFINNDPEIGGKLRVVFVPDFSVKLAQHIYPAADLSEQISTAGKEASGTGNMKFAMNGALTIGTLDGANVEIREEVGAENFFLFGLTAEEVLEKKRKGYRPRDVFDADPELRGVIDLIAGGTFSHGDRQRYMPIVSSLLESDYYMLFSDFAPYLAAQDEVARTYARPADYARMAILNMARVGKFSSDRSIADYCKHIWRVDGVQIQQHEERLSTPAPVP